MILLTLVRYIKRWQEFVTKTIKPDFSCMSFLRRRKKNGLTLLLWLFVTIEGGKIYMFVCNAIQVVTCKFFNGQTKIL